MFLTKERDRIKWQEMQPTTSKIPPLYIPRWQENEKHILRISQTVRPLWIFHASRYYFDNFPPGSTADFENKNVRSVRLTHTAGIRTGCTEHPTDFWTKGRDVSIWFKIQGYQSGFRQTFDGGSSTVLFAFCDAILTADKIFSSSSARLWQNNCVVSNRLLPLPSGNN